MYVGWFQLIVRAVFGLFPGPCFGQNKFNSFSNPFSNPLKGFIHPQNDVFEAQKAMVARFGLDFHEKLQLNLEVARRRDREERRRRDAEELTRTLASSWGARVVELRRQGVRVPTGAGTGGRQTRQRRETRQAKRRAETVGDG